MRAVRLVWCRVRPADGRALSYQRLGTVHGVLGVAGGRAAGSPLPLITLPYKALPPGAARRAAGPQTKMHVEKNGVSPLGQNGYWK